MSEPTAEYLELGGPAPGGPISARANLREIEAIPRAEARAKVEEPIPDEALLGHMRKRINVLINANLRCSFGQ